MLLNDLGLRRDRRGGTNARIAGDYSQITQFGATPQDLTGATSFVCAMTRAHFWLVEMAITPMAGARIRRFDASEVTTC